MTQSNGDRNAATVVIPTYNAGQLLLEVLDALTGQSVEPAQIIVIDSGSTDDTVKIAESRNCKVIAIEHSDFGHGRTRNLAISHVQTPFAVLLTQDATPADENMIAELIRPMQSDPNIEICYGRQLPRPDAGALESFARSFNYPEQSILKSAEHIKTMGLKTFFCSNSCSAVRPASFKQHNFRDDAIVNEDMLFAAEAVDRGQCVYYAAKARVYHSHNNPLRKTSRRYFNIGRFFADNNWILQKAGVGNYGSGMLKAGVKTFWKQRKPHCILALLIEFAVKASAFKLGWCYQLLSKRKPDTKAQSP